MLVPRCDHQENPGMSNPNNVRKVINVQITSRLYENSRVTLINSDQVLGFDNDEEKKEKLIQSDGYHLTQLGFQLMIENWSSFLVKHTDIHINNLKSVNPLMDAKDSVLLDLPNNVSCALLKETVPDPFGSYAAPEDVLSAKSNVDHSESIESDCLNDELNDDEVPNLETIEPEDEINSSQLRGFKLGQEETLEGEGFIEDDYCGNDLKPSEPVPSINLGYSGPESDIGPVSGKIKVPSMK